MVYFNLNQAGLLSAFVTAMALLAFSLVVGTLCRFRGPGRWYAVFGVGFSLAAALSHVSAAFLEIDLTGPTVVPAADGPEAASYWLSLGFVAASSLMAVVWTWGTVRLLDYYGGGPFRWMGWAGAAIAVLANIPSVLGPQVVESDALYLVFFNANNLAILAPVGWMGAAALIMARARRREHRAGQAILASALAAYPIAWAAWSAITGIPFSTASALGVLVVCLGAFVATQVGWLGLRSTGAGREAIAVAVVADLFLILGIVIAVFFPSESPAAVARIYDVVLVAYAILRLQYLDLDVKVRWGISKGTVAGIVVAFIFITSEAAQSIFGEDKQWLGLAVGGLVVFAIAPLQRAAERLAATAVPETRTVEGRSASETIYWEAFQAASRDGKVTQREEIHLARIADQLGIGAERALQLRDMVADYTQ